jgi:hypothetical protein
LKELQDGVLVILAPTLLLFVGAGLFETSSTVLSGLGAAAMFVAFAFGSLVGGFGLLLVFGGVLRLAFGRFWRMKND